MHVVMIMSATFIVKSVLCVIKHWLVLLSKGVSAWRSDKVQEVVLEIRDRSLRKDVW